jgi:hypothetical protein
MSSTIPFLNSAVEAMPCARPGVFGSVAGEPAGQPSKTQKIAVDAKTKHHPRSHPGKKGVRTEGLASRGI